MIFKEKPIISNQYGALVMAFVPFIYGISASHFVMNHFWLGLSWFFTYLFSYPFFSVVSKKQNEKYKRWMIIYAVFSGIFIFPILLSHFSILQFIIPILPLAGFQIYYAKQKDERNLINDIAGILTFGIIGMASFYLATNQYNFEILLHPTLFFIGTTIYVKSVARERKNPLYCKFSIGLHCIFIFVYLALGDYGISFAYFIGLIRAVIVPKRNWKIKQVGLFEFLVIFVFTLGLIY